MTLSALAIRYFLIVGLAWTVGGCGDDSTTSQSSTSSEVVTKSISSASKSALQATKTVASKSSIKVAEAEPVPVPKKEEPPKKPALPPETPEQVKAQCEGFLKAAWKTLGPAFAKLQIPNPDSFESTYLTNYDAKKFVKVCTLISQEDRACMVASKDPIASVHHCGIDSTKSGGKTLSWPSVPGESPLFKPTDRPKGEGAAILKKLAGSWINKGSYRTEIWTIDGAGKTSVVRLKKDGTPDKPRSTDQFTLSFSKVLQGKRTYPKSNSQDLSFIMNDSDVPSFYASGNMLYGVYDLKDGKNFVFRDGFHWGVVQDGVCAIVTKAGQVLSAQCERGNGIDSDLSVTYQIPGKKRRRTGVLEPTKTTYKVVQNHALSPQLVRIGHYVKQSQ
jgi:hypothetical protein